MKRRANILAGVVIGVAALSLTVLTGEYNLFNFALVASVAIVVLGLNLLQGRLGSISAGHGALMGVGGYCTAILVTNHGMPYPIAIILSTCVTGLVGLVIGLPSVRIRGMSLGIVTLGLAIVFPELVSYFASVTGGPDGLIMAPVQAPGFTGLDDPQWMYLITVLLLFAAIAGFALITKSPFGRGMDAVRVSEDLAVSCGVDTARTGVLTFAISAAYAGLGGSLYQLTLGSATPDTYSFALSLSLVFASVLGGMRGIWGAVVGAALIIYIPNYTDSLGADVPQLAYAILLLAAVYGFRFAVRGQVPSLFRKLDQARRFAHWSRRNSASDLENHVTSPNPEEQPDEVNSTRLAP